MRCLVTGAAGFIGSHLCEKLLSLGHEVIGVDAFIPYYPRTMKERNQREMKISDRYRFIEIDLRTDSLTQVVEGIDYVFHLAAMPGLAQSWIDFNGYWTCNVLATQRLLEAVRESKTRLRKFIYGSTSSVYGKFASGDETLPTKPISPYGVTKLAGEQLCRAYVESFDMPFVALRFFSVYGPRQRPDMAYNRFIQALLTGEGITVFGDGQQVRGNTYVGDCVSAVVASMDAMPGETFNIGGGEMVSIRDILARLELIAGKKFTVRTENAKPGDQRHTFADTTKLRRHLGWEPQTSLDEGLALQWDWQRKRLANPSS